MLQNISVFTLQISHTTVEFVINHLYEKTILQGIFTLELRSMVVKIVENILHKKKILQSIC